MASSVIDKALRQTMQDQVKKVELWRNASPGSSFGEQDINLNLVGFDSVIVRARYSVNNANEISEEIALGKGGELVLISNNWDKTFQSRSFSASDDGIRFGTNKNVYYAGSAATTANSTFIIPQVIYGCKRIIGGAID